MRWQAVLVVAIVGSLSVPTLAQDDKDKVKTEMKRFEGTWKVVSATRAGKAAKELEGAKITFAGEKITVEIRSDTRTGSFAVALPPANMQAALATISLQPSEPGEKALQGVYQFEGADGLKIHLDRDVPPTTLDPRVSRSVLLDLKKS